SCLLTVLLTASYARCQRARTGATRAAAARSAEQITAHLCASSCDGAVADVDRSEPDDGSSDRRSDRLQCRSRLQGTAATIGSARDGVGVGGGNAEPRACWYRWTDQEGGG